MHGVGGQRGGQQGELRHGAVGEEAAGDGAQAGDDGGAGEALAHVDPPPRLLAQSHRLDDDQRTANVQRVLQLILKELVGAVKDFTDYHQIGAVLDVGSVFGGGRKEVS